VTGVPNTAFDVCPSCQNHVIKPKSRVERQQVHDHGRGRKQHRADRPGQQQERTINPGGHMASIIEPKVLLDGLVIGESPRWHDDRLWFAHWGTGEIVALDLDGNSEVVAQGPSGLGWSIDWLPDGHLLLTGEELLRREPDGSMVPHADLTHLDDHRWKEIVVDGRGNV
jgi:hypothetical protein